MWLEKSQWVSVHKITKAVLLVQLGCNLSKGQKQTQNNTTLLLQLCGHNQVLSFGPCQWSERHGDKLQLRSTE